MTAGWEPVSGTFPWPPANGTAMSAFHSSDTDIRWDDPSTFISGPSTPSTRATVSITVDGTPDLLAAATATFTVVGAPIAAGETVEVGGIVLTSAGAAAGVDEFDSSSADPTVVAANLAAAITTGSVGSWGVATATAAGALITLTAGTAGSAGNSTTISSDSASITPSGSTFADGSDADTITIGGQTLTTNTSRTEGGMDFDVGPTNFDTAASISAAINDATNTLGFVTSQVSGAGNVVLISAFLDGTMGDGILISTTNTTVFVASDSQTRGGTGVPCNGKSNSEWDILGVNVYRSNTGERGPYFRVNQVPVMTNFFRDKTDIVEVKNEVIPWDTGWIFQGSAPNRPDVWRLRTYHRNMIKSTGNAVPADSSFDVEVYFDGTRVPVAMVFGPNGEITLDTTAIWDPSTESWVQFTPPTATTTVTVNYYYKRNEKLVNTLDNRHKVFYRLTTVAVDTTSPTGLIETPLGYTAPISPMNSEKMDYIWKEAIRRNRWILEQGGERVKLFIRRISGVKCDCMWDERLEEWSQQPVNNCVKCYGTGWRGGYEGPIDIIIAPDDAERRVTQTANGRQLQHQYEVWIGPSPMTSQRDFIVKQNGERYSVGPVRRTQVRGLILQQSFQIGYLDTTDIRYKVPMGQLERLPWPQTRFSNPEDSECQTSDPYPEGYDYQASPMGTEVNKIDDAREQRGRTPVWANITYGGNG